MTIENLYNAHNRTIYIPPSLEAVKRKSKHYIYTYKLHAHPHVYIYVYYYKKKKLAPGAVYIGTKAKTKICLALYNVSNIICHIISQAKERTISQIHLLQVQNSRNQK